MLSILKSKYLPWILVGLAISYIGLQITREITKQKGEDTKQTAIENPAIDESEEKIVERIVEVIKTVEGETRTITKEKIRYVKEKIQTPIVPENKIDNKPTIYLSGGYGANIGGDKFSQAYHIATGYYISKNISVGARIIIHGNEKILLGEITLSF